MAEWLGSALQKQLQRFESASDLQTKTENPVNIALAGFCFFTVQTSALLKLFSIYPYLHKVAFVSM
tara:strand:- start:224 stop:421 length:198 start_codon:yes stop_codon:yes gene_type:complete